MKKALITDVDNTLFDWVDIWARAFSAMIASVEELSGISASELYPEISLIHQKYHTSEYAFLLEEMPSLQAKFGLSVLEELAPAVEAFRHARNEAMRLYPGVSETLSALSDRGVVIVAYTESMSFYTNYRFRKLGLDRVIDYLYSPPDHELPTGDLSQLRRYPLESYSLAKTVHRHTPEGELKPNPGILLSILDDIGVAPEDAVYVGDSPMKDIVMAQQAGVLDVHAKYGAAQHREDYDLLRKVTHWSPEDVERERAIVSGAEVTPTLVLEEKFSEILSLFEIETKYAQ